MSQKIYTIQARNIDCVIFNEYTPTGNGKYTRKYFRMMKNSPGQMEYWAGSVPHNEYTEEEFQGKVCNMSESEFHYMLHMIKTFGMIQSQLSSCITNLFNTYSKDT